MQSEPEIGDPVLVSALANRYRLRVCDVYGPPNKNGWRTTVGKKEEIVEHNPFWIRDNELYRSNWDEWGHDRWPGHSPTGEAGNENTYQGVGAVNWRIIRQNTPLKGFYLRKRDRHNGRTSGDSSFTTSRKFTFCEVVIPTRSQYWDGEHALIHLCRLEDMEPVETAPEPSWNWQTI